MDAGLGELLHRTCGTVELAKDLVGRSQCLYMGAATVPDRLVVERFTDAVRALEDVAQALEAHVRTTRLGPAA